MATKIVTKNSSTASAVPTASDLVQGELAVNVADKRLFTEDNAGAIVELGTNPYNFTANHNGAAKLATTATGIDVTGAVNSDTLDVTGSTGTIARFRDSTNGIIDIKTTGTTNADPMQINGSNRNIELAVNGLAKLTATSTGIDVTGTATMDGLEIGDNQWIYAGNGADLKIGHDGTDNIIRAQGSPLYIDANGTTFRGYSPYTKHMDIASNGDISFYEDTGTTAKFFWDASAESLGIGTSSPFFTTGGRSSLSVNGSSSSILAFGKGGSSENYILADSGGFTIANTSATLPTTFFNNGAERLTIDSAGNVGIGTSSPSALLDLGTSTGQKLLMYANAAIKYGMAIETSEYRMFAEDQAALTFGHMARADGTTYTERMRIDSAGNLLVGGTSAFGADTITLGTGGFAGIRNTSGSCLELRRDSTDGSILDFQKDGTTVGSIQSRAGLVTNIILDPRADGAGLTGTTNTIEPVDETGTRVDNTINLASSAYRFKDLYLSGTATMGGLTVDGTSNLNGVAQIGGSTDLLYLSGKTGTHAYLSLGASNTAADFFIGADTAIPLIFRTAATERMRINSAGRVGINTADIPPNSWLTVEGGAYDLNQYTMHLRSYTPSLVFQDVSTAATDFEIQADTGALMFRYGDASTNVQLASEAMRVDSGGNLLVGAIASAGGARLEVTENSGNLVYFKNSSGTGLYMVAGGTAWLTASDERIKDIIEPISGAVGKLSSLRTVIGKYKTDQEGVRRPFLIAQDLQAVFPEAVNEQEDELKTLGVEYSSLIPLLIAGMKEQQNLIESLTARVAALEE